MPASEILRWIGVALLGALSLLMIGSQNPLTFRRDLRRLRMEGNGTSMVPFIGGLAGAAAILLSPVGTMQQRLAYAWIPLVLDITFPMYLYLLVVVLPRAILRRLASSSPGAAPEDRTNEERPQ